MIDFVSLKIGFAGLHIYDSIDVTDWNIKKVVHHIGITIDNVLVPTYDIAIEAI